MNVKKQQMRLQLQQQQPPQTRHNRTGFETLLDQSAAERRADACPAPILSRGGVSWSPDGRHQLRHADHRPHASQQQSPAAGRSAAGVDAVATAGSPAASVASPLSLPSPYYDRNPVVAFPFHGPKSPPATVGSVPLANVQNVAYADQDPADDHYAISSKFFYPKHNNGYRPGAADDDKENIKQRQDPEILQQQLDEVLRACADYEEQHRCRQPEVPAAESDGNGGSPEAAATSTTPPQQNRIKTNGSLPRDAKMPGAAETSSSTATWPSGSTPSPTTTAALSPLSPPSLTPLSLNDETAAGDGGDQKPPTENGRFATSSAATRDSPGPRTLVPDTSADQQQQNSDDHNAQPVAAGHRQCNGNEENNYGSPELLKRQPSPGSYRSTMRSPLWQTTASWLRSSPFADAIDGGGATATVSENAAEQRRKLLVELSTHKSRLVELHLRREEVDRELIIETALLRAELDAADDETRQSENIVDGLDRAVAECRQQMDLCTVKQQEQTAAAEGQLVGYRNKLQLLRSRLESIEDDDELKTEIRASIENQTELLEAEQKLYEDVEFGLLEEEAGWLARREELHRDRAAAVAVRRARRARAEWLRAQLDQLRSVGDDQLRALRHDVNAATLSIQQGHKKLLELDAATGVQDQPYRRNPFPCSAGSERSSAGDQQRQPRSAQDWPWNDRQLLQLKSPVVSPSLWDRQCSKSPVSPWSCHDPVGFPSADAADECNNAAMMTSSVTTTCCSSVGSVSGAEDDGCRPASEDSISRMSMSTIFDGGAGIKMRQKNKTSHSDITKRPLTRYLPVRHDGDGTAGNQVAFDLRAHIESAGHQLDTDGSADDKHFWIDSASCRGYLKKLSGAGGKRGRKWLKRWFVFDRRSRTLAYYHRKSDEDAAGNRGCNASSTEKKTVRPRASIHFRDIQEVYVDHTNTSKGQGCAFVVKTVQRTFFLSAATGQAVRVWVDVIFTGAEGYREYLKASPNNGIARSRDGRRD